MPQFQKTILITGGTVGLGYETALAIAKDQSDTEIVLCSRTDKEHAADTINKALHQSNVSFQPLDLSSQSEIRAFASAWDHQNHTPITALILNAALQFPGTEPVYTKDGVEMTFGITHLGHALLFYLLRSHLAPNCRIVITASGVHDPEMKTGIPDAVYTSAEALAHPSGDALKISGLQRYSTSKLCNVLWMYALDRHIRDLQKTMPSNKWTVTAMDPGLMLDTSLGRNYPAPIPWIARQLRGIVPWLNWFVRLILGPNVHTSAESGAALARLAIGNDVESVSGRYYEGLRERESSKASREVEKQEELWSGTVRLVAKDEDERKRWEELS